MALAVPAVSCAVLLVSGWSWDLLLVLGPPAGPGAVLRAPVASCAVLRCWCSGAWAWDAVPLVLAWSVACVWSVAGGAGPAGPVARLLRPLARSGGVAVASGACRWPGWRRLPCPGPPFSRLWWWPVVLACRHTVRRCRRCSSRWSAGWRWFRCLAGWLGAGRGIHAGRWRSRISLRRVWCVSGQDRQKIAAVRPRLAFWMRRRSAAKQSARGRGGPGRWCALAYGWAA